MRDDPFFKRKSILVIIALSVFVLGFVDYVTGYELGFFLFYFGPITIVAWKVGPTSSYSISILSSIVRVISDISSHLYSNILAAFWNIMMRLLSFLTIASSTSKIQFLLVKECETSRNRLSQVKTLSGLIPICASCKQIRNEKGSWQRIEEYVEERTNAEFTHGLCPECVDKLLKEAHIDNLLQPTGHLLGTAAKQTFAIRKSFRGRSPRVQVK